VTDPPKGQLKWWGNAYSVRVRFADGRRKWVRLPKGMSHEEALAKATELAMNAKTTTVPETVVAIARPSETFSAWSERWLAWREKSGLESVRDDRSRLRTHVLPLLASKQMRAIASGHVEDLRDALDEKVRAGDLSWRTAQNVWALVHAAFRDASASKNRALRVRKDNPTAHVEPPDRGTAKAKQYLYPNEFLKLVTCDEVPLRWRRLAAVAVYVAARAAELEGLHWDDVDLVRGVIHVHRSTRRYTRELKKTKTGETRRFAIEPTLLPLLMSLHEETGGTGRVLASTPMPNKCELANGLRLWLAVAGVDRDELFANDATRKWMTFHDLRATGLTWMAVRGDDALRIKQRAGHACFATTERYVREAEAISRGFGEVFPTLPAGILESPT